MSYTYFDVLRRYLQHVGYRVRHIQNFTDIDDKIIQRANQQGVGIAKLAQRYIDDYMACADRLGLLRADVYALATVEIPYIVEFIETLIEKDVAYVSDGDVYFRVQKFRTYGALSHRKLDEMLAGARVEPGEKKEHPGDFALWKASKAGEPYWPSPWGPGRPGWHIECSAMSLRYLGTQIDIHGGGQDLIFPHHENEIAETEAYTGVAPFANFWVHNGLLNVSDQKMSKSAGNFISWKEALDRYSPEALRLFFLSSHYRSPLLYSDEHVATQSRALERLRGAVEPALGTGSELDATSFRKRFTDAMDDDLNTPQALAALFDLAHEIYRGRDTGRAVGSAQTALLEMAGVLGLNLKPSLRDDSAGPFVNLLVETRERLRAAKQFTLADEIRHELLALGIVLEDSPQGVKWKFRS